MTAHRFSDDDAVILIGRSLLDRSLPKPCWTHAAHFAALLWMLRCRHDLLPSRDLPGIIRAYNEATGVANTDSGGYHETITQASIRAAVAFVAAHRTLGLHETCNRLMQSALGDPGWLLAHWSRERLFSVQARRHWVAPDLLPLPPSSWPVLNLDDRLSVGVETTFS